MKASVTEVRLPKSWLAGDIKRVRDEASFSYWCRSLHEVEREAIYRFIEERRASMANQI